MCCHVIPIHHMRLFPTNRRFLTTLKETTFGNILAKCFKLLNFHLQRVSVFVLDAFKVVCCVFAVFWSVLTSILSVFHSTRGQVLVHSRKRCLACIGALH